MVESKMNEVWDKFPEVQEMRLYFGKSYGPYTSSVWYIDDVIVDGKFRMDIAEFMNLTYDIENVFHEQLDPDEPIDYIVCKRNGEVLVERSEP